MARSIVLRFDAQCYDCGAALPAGSTARWFGKGRVSCCGSDAAPSSPARAPGAPSPVRQPLPPRMAPSVPSSPAPLPAPLPLKRCACGARATVDSTPMAASGTWQCHACAGIAAPAPAAAPHKAIPPYLPSPELAELARATGIDVAELASGMRPAQVAILAERAPAQRLLVRLSSGARFIVPARDCAHVIRCVEESLVDRCRDVSLLADGGS